MSNIQFVGGAIDTKKTKITTTAVTAVTAVSTNRTTVASISCCEIAGNTPNLSVEIYNGTTSYFLQSAKQMTARATVVFDQGYLLAVGETIRVTASVANSVDVIITYVLPTNPAT